MQPVERKLVYRVPDLARLLSTTEAAVRRMIQTGAIPSRRLGRRVVVIPQELEAHLKTLRQAGENEGD